MSPYIIGHRQAISVLDLTNAAFRLQKFLLFVRLVLKQHSQCFFILNPTASSLIPSILSIRQSFSGKWIGGVLTNYAYCGYFFFRNRSFFFSYYVPRLYPGAVVSIANHQAINETRLTRTPAAFLADSGSNVYLAFYGIIGSSEMTGFKMLVDLTVSACRTGLRHRKISFARTLYLKLRGEMSQKPQLTYSKILEFSHSPYLLDVMEHSFKINFFHSFLFSFKLRNFLLFKFKFNNKQECEPKKRSKFKNQLYPFLHNVSTVLMLISHFRKLSKFEHLTSLMKNSENYKRLPFPENLRLHISKIGKTNARDGLEPVLLKKIGLSPTRLPNSAHESRKKNKKRR
jgi:hypothetical protein